MRFDPDNLLRDVHLYDLQGHYLCAAQLMGDVNFLDAAEAKATAKRVSEYRRKIRDAVEAEGLLSAAQVASLQVDAPMPILPEPQVIRPVRHRGQVAAALKPLASPEQSNHESKVFAALRLVKSAE